MLVVALRAPLRALLRDTWFYSRFDVLPYKFGLGGVFVTIMTILIALYLFFKWMDYAGKSARHS